MLLRAKMHTRRFAVTVSFRRKLLVLLSCSFSLPVLGNQLLLLSDAVDWL